MSPPSGSVSSKDKGKGHAAETSPSPDLPKVPHYIPRAPFTTCHDAPPPFRKKGAPVENIMEVFKQVKINLPLLDAIQQIPSYAKFLKDLCTHKRKA